MQNIGWVAIVAFIIGGAIRLLKSDSIPIDIPAKWRPWLAVALGVAAAAVDALAAGESWQVAIQKGIAAAFSAIAGHQLIVESAMGGKELMHDSSKPGSDK